MSNLLLKNIDGVGTSILKPKISDFQNSCVTTILDFISRIDVPREVQITTLLMGD